MGELRDFSRRFAFEDAILKALSVADEDFSNTISEKEFTKMIETIEADMDVTRDKKITNECIKRAFEQVVKFTNDNPSYRSLQGIEYLCGDRDPLDTREGEVPIRLLEN